MAQLSIHLLGGFYAAADGQPVVELYQARFQSLLAYLLLRLDLPVPRRQVAYAFWPESSDKQALNNLRTLLFRLRKIWPDAENYLLLDRHTIRWRSDSSVFVDVTAFDEAVERARLLVEAGDTAAAKQVLQEASNLYHGDLLPGNYEAWVEPERARLREAQIWTVGQLVAIFAAEGEQLEAIQYARQLLEQNPLSETVYRQLMRLHMAAGDRASALQTFAQLKENMAEMLGAYPSPETLELHRRILV